MNFFCIGLLLLIGVVNLAQAQKRIPVLSDLYRIQEVDEPDASPDGKAVVYSVHQLHPSTNQSSTNLWTVLLDNKQKKQLTFSKGATNSQPKWSSDGRWIAYLSDASETTQIWLYSVKSGGKLQLTHFDGDISDFTWSPNSKEIAFIGKEMKKKDAKHEPIVINRYEFKNDEERYLTNQRDHLYLLHIKNKMTRSCGQLNFMS
jgi:Tol biopolymer transport system component